MKAALSGIPFVGPLLGAATGTLTADPRGTARTLLQFSFILISAAWVIFGINGRRIAMIEDDRTFDAAGFESTGSAKSPSAKDDTDSGGDTSGPGPKGAGADGIRAGLHRTGKPITWAESPGLWNILWKESRSRPKGLRYPTNPKSGAAGPFQLNPSSGTLQKYAGKPPYTHKELVDGGLNYIADNYGNPEHAWQVWQTKGWY